MEFYFAVQTPRLSITWSQAQQTLLFFLTGKRPRDLDITALVNGTEFKDSIIQVEYKVHNV